MTALHRDHYDVLVAFVLRYVDGRDEAEDVMQETLLRAWRTIERVDLDTALSYLFTVARNVVTDRWRATQVRPATVSDDRAIDQVSAHDDIEAALEAQLVAAGLERLTADHRAVVQLLYCDGVSVAEAARRLTVPEGTVKSRAYYAVRSLRAAFEEMGVMR
ncbi:sigma-70 family RNA polymerase sigma factor [Streptomyces sp. NPDC058247]|uniref:sigma-70 family RNA polymerase sigma factor n=1 Tax=Streptomyces sp. NPDC058247 TaxID=3346401 RepID=UPI0036EA896B